MFGLFSKKKIEKLENETKKSFDSVKNDMDKVGKWIKHLDQQDKQLFDVLNTLEQDISTIREEVESLREGLDLVNESQEFKQVSKKRTGVYKQLGVYGVEKDVQTAVQTANFYEILQELTANERLIIFAILRSGEEMKLSYEDIARLLGKEKSTVRGQINSIKRKSESLIEEITEPNGKKRVYIPEYVREKLEKYAKVRGEKKKKRKKKA